MNIPKVILNDRKIISSEVYHYYQSLAQQLIKNQRNSNINVKKNYSKEKILNWFSNLNIKQKFKICSIYNNWFSNIIYQMLEYSRFDSVIEFCPTDVYLEFKKNNLYEYNYLKTELSCTDKIKNCDNFITFFIGENKVKKSIGIPDETELININLKNHYENLFFAYLRFITLDELNDTISFSSDLFEHPERLFDFFNFFSKEQCFTSVINPILEKNNCYNFSFPNWVYNYQSYSFCQLLIIFFEQIISVYYQLYLYAKEIPQLSIDNKFTNFFKTNENIKEYLSNKIKNKNDIIINREECFDKINNKINSDKYSYYENKSAFVYSIAFGPSFFEKNINKKREFNLRFNYLMEFIQKDVNGFIEKISFIEAKECFKYTNFIYYVIYQQLIKQCSDSCYQELLSEEKNKTQNESGTNKTKKNKRRKKKKKKTENDNNKEIENANNNIITDEYNEEESKKNIIEEGEEEIEEIPADYIIHPKTEQNLKESESNNNNIINSNDINNSTVSSSYTNKYSKDNNYNFGPKYNNFFKCEKKETEMLLEIKDFTDDKSEDSNEENEKNNKIELEDISENDISEENNHNEYNNNSTLNESENKKKKKKHKKRNKKKKNAYIIAYTDYELNEFEYEEAIKLDNRTYCQYYISLIRTKHLIVFSFFNNNDYNSKIIKIYLFLFNFAINYTISAMFYSETMMHRIYIDSGAFDFIYQLPEIIYSAIITAVLNTIITTLGLSQNNIIKIKKSSKEKIGEITRTELDKILYKIILFFIITYILLFSFWIYLGCFCAVYKNTQLHLLKEVSSSFASSLIIPFFTNLLPGIFRIPALDKDKKRSCLYKFSKIIQMI